METKPLQSQALRRHDFLNFLRGMETGKRVFPSTRGGTS